MLPQLVRRDEEDLLPPAFAGEAVGEAREELLLDGGERTCKKAGNGGSGAGHRDLIVIVPAPAENRRGRNG
jgi:hypothetical protein